MVYSYGKVAGTLIFIAATQLVVGMMISEALYPGYSISRNYISDLGVGPSALIFNSSVFLLGLLLIVGAYFLQRAFRFEVLTLMLVLTGIGAMGVGTLTEHFGVLHLIVSAVTFLFGGLSAIFSVLCSRVHKFPLVKMPFSALSVILGLIALAAMGLFFGRLYLELDTGGMERMIAYPVLMWGAGFGGYLIAFPEERATEQKSQ